MMQVRWRQRTVSSVQPTRPPPTGAGCTHQRQGTQRAPPLLGWPLIRGRRPGMHSSASALTPAKPRASQRQAADTWRGRHGPPPCSLHVGGEGGGTSWGQGVRGGPASCHGPAASTLWGQRHASTCSAMPIECMQPRQGGQCPSPASHCPLCACLPCESESAPAKRGWARAASPRRAAACSSTVRTHCRCR